MNWWIAYIVTWIVVNHISLNLSILLIVFELKFILPISFAFCFLGPRSNDTNNLTYVGFERDVFKTIADYFLNLPEPLLTFEYYELFVNILGMCEFYLIFKFILLKSLSFFKVKSLKPW